MKAIEMLSDIMHDNSFTPQNLPELEKKLFLNFKYPSAKLVEILDSLNEDEEDSPAEQSE